MREWIALVLVSHVHSDAKFVAQSVHETLNTPTQFQILFTINLSDACMNPSPQGTHSSLFLKLIVVYPRPKKGTVSEEVNCDCL